MTDDKRYEIAVLAEDAHKKRARFRMLSIMGTPTEVEEQIKAAIELAIAEAESIEADRLLTIAVYSFPSKKQEAA